MRWPQVAALAIQALISRSQACVLNLNALYTLGDKPPRMAKLVPRDWQPLYVHPIYWLETFVDHHKPAGQRTSKAASPGHVRNVAQ
jgi:hypothetical protein